MLQMDTRKSGSTSSLLSNMMADTKLDWLLEDISLQIPFNQSKIRQVRRSAVYQFGFLIPKDYKQALQLDE